jgi:8-hydroxy-5-deazaflavin:NADPH oxidoreductase
MDIGIIGTGNMGRVLGALWAELGHRVTFGARDPAKARGAAELCARNGVGANARTGSNDDAAAFGEIVYFNPRDVAPHDLLTDPAALDGKVVIESHNGPLPQVFQAVPVQLSRSERLQADLPGARVVKAFNTMAQEVFDLCPVRIRDAQVSVFVASDHDDAKATVTSLALEMGFLPVDCGPLSSARQLEGLGDFIRSIIVSRSDVMATLSVHSLHAVAIPRFGSRSPSRLP